MKTALTSAYYPDDATESFGQLDEALALAKFDEFPWSTLAQMAREITLERGGCIDASLTFLIDKCHIMTRVREDAESFDIEVCVTRAKKILGFIDYPKFYEIEGLSTEETRAALRVFFEKTDVEKHAYFSDLAQRHKQRKLN